MSNRCDQDGGIDVQIHGAWRDDIAPVAGIDVLNRRAQMPVVEHPNCRSPRVASATTSNQPREGDTGELGSTTRQQQRAQLVSARAYHSIC